LREYVQSLRAIWTAWETGERLNYEGKHYHFTLMPPYFIPVSQHMKMVPVTLAAVGPHSLRLAGEVADGVRLHGFCTRRYLTEEILPRLAEGMARSGRDRASLRSQEAASSPPGRTTRPLRRWSNTSGAASPSMARPRVTGRC
jgi:alkanesulfonate monooxygenase SsuD/methylene tetrahydromethanopterin reductase-like flavin-dependent oxidoreductase (luciferase family)